MHALPVNLPCVKQLPVITNEAGASPHAGSTCAIGVVTVRPFNRQPAQLYFKLTPDPNNTFFFIFTCTTQYPWVLANPDLSQAMASSKQKRTHTVFRASSTHRSASTSKPRFVGEKVRLGDVATYVNGYAFKPSDYSDSGLPIVRIQNLTGNAYRTNRYEGTLPEKFAIQDGDILISWSASLGVFEWNQGPAWLNQHIFRVVFNKAMIDKRFFVHQARFLIQKSQNLAHGATMKHLTKKVFETLPFLYLGLNNQITIAEQLDALDTQINRAKRQIRFLDNLAKSRFVEIFGDLKLNKYNWPIEPFESFAVIDTHIANNLDAYANKPHIGIDSIESNSGRLSGYRTVAEDGIISGKYPFTAQHIIYSKIRPALNKVALPDFDGVCSADAYPILPAKERCNRIYLAQVMRSSYFLDYVLPLSGRAQMPKVNKKALQGFSMPLPPLELQQEFATFVSQVDKSRFVRDHEINFR